MEYDSLLVEAKSGLDKAKLDYLANITKQNLTLNGEGMKMWVEIMQALQDGGNFEQSSYFHNAVCEGILHLLTPEGDIP